VLASFFAYPVDFAGGVNVAAGDVNGDGKADIITGAGPGGGPHVRVFDGATGNVLASFMAYDTVFAGGVTVAAADVNDDGRADIVTGAGPGGGPHVKAFSGATGAVLASFMANDPTFTGGVSVAAGDTNNDGRAEIITGSGSGSGPLFTVFNPSTGAATSSFFAYESRFEGGVRVAAHDVNGDGKADILTGAGPGGGPHVKAFDGTTGTALRSFFAFDPTFGGGVFIG
jgi:hypothetical protein